MPFEVVPSEEVAYRTDLPLLCDARGLVDAVEVGTDCGVYARQFLERFGGNWLYCVDPYEPHPEFPFDRSADLTMAATALAPFHGRVRFVRARSVDAAPWVASVFARGPEFVYLDGDHTEAGVAADIAAWWPLLSPHGVLAGHDFDGDHPGVVAAVTAFARRAGLRVRVTHEAESPPSWYCYRSEPAPIRISQP